jgi:uncharacterized protein (TIGR02145 family)
LKILPAAGRHPIENKILAMKKTLFLSIVLLLAGLYSFSQNIAINLAFSGDNNGTYVQLDSIKVMNRTYGGTAMAYWPDTTVSLQIIPGDLLLFVGYSTVSSVGVKKINPAESEFGFFRNYPNPVRDKSTLSIYIPQKGPVNFLVTDLYGRVLLSADRDLDKGSHLFTFTPCDMGLFLVTATWSGISRSIKIFAEGSSSGNRCSLDYTGTGVDKNRIKESEIEATQESGILGSPLTDTAYVFQFATNIPCPGMPTVTYEGQVYNTIQVYSQCWMKENLNAGMMIPGYQEQANNNVLEKYCYDDDPGNCTTYGGLYQWNEIMQYPLAQDVHDICPKGWHIPSDEEWKILEGATDSQVGIGDISWDGELFRGSDAGLNLKSEITWGDRGNGTDLFGFSGLSSGIRGNYGSFTLMGCWGNWWSSTKNQNNDSWYRYLSCVGPETGRYYYPDDWGFSVRCVRDN